MGVATTTASSVVQVISPRKISVAVGSMSQGFHHHRQDIFGFSATEQEQQQQHVAQQSRRDKLRMQGFEPAAAAASHHTHPLVGGGIEEDDVDDEGGGGGRGIYGEAPAVATNMLSEMFNFPGAASATVDPAGPTATELLASQIHGAGGYRLPPTRQVVPGSMVGFGNVDWYGGDGSGGGGSASNDLSTISDAKQLNPESAAAMQLFLMNPQQQQPRSPPPHQHQHHLFEGSFSGGHQLVDSQGLSLSLSSSLHQFEMAKAEQNVLYFQQPPPQQQHQLQQQLQSQGGGGYGGGAAAAAAAAAAAVGVNLQLRNSRYARAAQELLEEFCSVGRGGQHFRGGSSRGKHHGGGGASSSSNPNPSGGAAAAVGSSSSSKDVLPALSPADRFEHQRNKSKLLTMLDEVDRRYNHYCEQMQMVVTSFDSVMGYGAATPYTALAQKAMSRHFRCLKDAIGEQLRRACEALGEKDVTGGSGGSGITKGETPRLRLLDQSLRQQRAFHQMGMIDQEAWRPQRGLPERSVTLLRAWLFEHFLHPYPSDADKHLLARQTGLSRNQVSNWFINARVRLWKPMVEEMYQQESKDETDVGHDTVQTAADDHQATAAAAAASHSSAQQHQHHYHSQQQVLLQRPETEASSAAGAGDSDLTSMHQRFPNIDHVINDANILPSPANDPATAAGLGPAARTRLGTTAAGDVSLTLGLRHAGTGGSGSGSGSGGGGGQDINSRFTTVRDHFGG